MHIIDIPTSAVSTSVLYPSIKLNKAEQTDLMVQGLGSGHDQDKLWFSFASREDWPQQWHACRGVGACPGQPPYLAEQRDSWHCILCR